jgi:hypothetical protein
MTTQTFAPGQVAMFPNQSQQPPWYGQPQFGPYGFDPLSEFGAYGAPAQAFGVPTNPIGSPALNPMQFGLPVSQSPIGIQLQQPAVLQYLIVAQQCLAAAYHTMAETTARGGFRPASRPYPVTW